MYKFVSPLKKAFFILVVGSFSLLQAASIVATVNNKAISRHDLENRLKLAIISAGLQNTAQVQKELQEQILKILIDEQIQLDIGEEFKIKIDDTMIQAALREIENQNNMPEGELKNMLEKQEIPFSVMQRHLQASLIWREYIRERYSTLVQVSDAELKRARSEMEAAKEQTRYALSEIVLYGDDKNDPASLRVQADRIVAQLKQGAQFTALAQQFSQAPSAMQGGYIGWIPVQKLDPKVAEALSQLEVGQVSYPIQTGRGYHIYYVRDKLAPGQHAKSQTTVTFKQVFIPHPKDAFEFELKENMRQVAALSRQINGCRSVETLVARKNATIQNVKDIPLNNLPPELRNLLNKTPDNKASDPIYTNTGAMIFVVCEKKTINPQEPTPEELRATLVEEKLQNVAAQEMRTRRSSAHIEKRF